MDNKTKFARYCEAVNKSPLCAFLVSCILGFIGFALLYGTRTINPTYTDWIFVESGDIAQHHLGWIFYRKSPWHFPIGLIDGLTCDGSVSCMYTDSIPLFAVFFKILSPILPDNFQYIGLWLVMTYMLNGGFAAVLLHKFRQNILYTSFGSLFYIIFPPTIGRTFHHDSLTAIWLLLIPLILCVYRDKKWKYKATPVILWALCAGTAVLVHSYFLPMIYMVMLGYIILDIGHTKKVWRSLIIFVSSTAYTLFVMWIIGAFYGSGKLEENGLGYYNANLNCFFNSYGLSKFLVPMNIVEGQGEGFSYLGLGAILCLFLAVFTLLALIERKEGNIFRNTLDVLKKYKFEIIAFAAVFLCSFLFAMSIKGTLNARILYELDPPEWLRKKLSIFRASGRFVWLAAILTLTFALGTLPKLGKKAGTAAIMLCLMIQVVDIKPWRNSLYNHYSVEMVYTDTIEGEKWDEIADGATEIIFSPLPTSYLTQWRLYYNFALFADKKNMTLSSFYLARADYQTLADYAALQYGRLCIGQGREDVLYVFFKADEVPKNVEGLKVYQLDGYVVARLKR